MSLAGKVVVVTGASSGIGRALAAELAQRGAAVVGFARRFERDAIGEISAGTVVEARLDVTDAGAVAARFGEIGHIDALVCNAGGGVFASVDDIAIEDVRAMFEAHVVGTLLCCRAALPALRAGGGGHIVVVGSTSATTAFVDNAGYAAAKAGQRAVAGVLREEARAAEVRVTYAVVGAVDTPIWDARDGFDRAAMMRAEDVAAAITDVIGRDGVSVDEIVIAPPGGAL